MIHLFITLALLTVAPLVFAEDNIKPFTTDGCSAFPNGTFEQQELWLSCCTAHDLAYWQGGTYEQRMAADQALHSCVEKLGEPAVAALMLTGVRVGGTPYLPTEFRWGYGWPYLRGYKAVTAEEEQKIRVRLRSSKDVIVDFIKHSDR